MFSSQRLYVLIWVVIAAALDGVALAQHSPATSQRSATESRCQSRGTMSVYPSGRRHSLV